MRRLCGNFIGKTVDAPHTQQDQNKGNRADPGEGIFENDNTGHNGNHRGEGGENGGPNVRWGDERTFETAGLGVESGKTIAVGTHGCIKTVEGRKMFIAGFDYVINRLKPKTVLVYGRMPDKIFCLAKLYGVELVQFESEFSLSHQKEVN